MNRYVFSNLGRNLRASWRTYFLGACVSAIAFSLCGGFFLGHRNLVLTTRLWSATVPVTIVLAPEIAPGDLDAVVKAARALGPERIDVVSPEEGMQRVEAALGGGDLLAGFLENPLPSMIELRFRNAPPAAGLANLAILPGVAEVDDASSWVERFGALTRAVDRVGSALIVLLLFAAIGSVALSVRLVAASHAAENEIQHMIGATRSFIQSPYLMAGALLGTAGVGLSLALLGGGYLLLQSALASGLPLPLHAPVFFTWAESAGLGAGGAAVGALGAWFGLTRSELP
jgi:cell division transport system permease protein